MIVFIFKRLLAPWLRSANRELFAYVVGGRATGGQHAAQKAARWYRWEENSQHVIIMPAWPPPAVHLLGHYFNGTNETLRHLYALCLTRELDGRMRHNRGYNSHLGWTDVRRRARPAFGPRAP